MTEANNRGSQHPPVYEIVRGIEGELYYLDFLKLLQLFNGLAVRVGDNIEILRYDSEEETYTWYPVDEIELVDSNSLMN